MSIFSKENLGGMISSTGFKQQDCAAIVYMFRYLDEKMKCVTFEHVEDFTIDFEDEKRLFAQVKVNTIDMKFLKNMIEDYYRPGELNLFIGSGLDDKVRNLLMKKRKYEESKTLLSHQEAETDFTEECKKYGLVLEEINEIKVDAFDSFNCVSIAKNEINEWADKHCIFVDSQRILEELIAKISLDLRPYGGVMSKEDIIECICRHKKSKIVSLNDGSSFDESKKNIIKELERLMKKMHREYDLLNVVKFEIEADCYLEALNSISGLYEAYHTEYIIDDKDIEVKLIKKKNSLDGIVNVGGYIVDIYIPNVGEGYQEFMRKYDSKSAYDEAVLLLVSPVEVTQITFMKNNICKIER